MLPDPKTPYSEPAAKRLSPAVTGALARVYVPNVRSNDVDVIAPSTLEVVDHFQAGRNPQHVVPSWDLKTLWVTGSSRHNRGSLTPIDSFSGKRGMQIKVPGAFDMDLMS